MPFTSSSYDGHTAGHGGATECGASLVEIDGRNGRAFSAIANRLLFARRRMAAVERVVPCVPRQADRDVLLGDAATASPSSSGAGRENENGGSPGIFPGLRHWRHGIAVVRL